MEITVQDVLATGFNSLPEELREHWSAKLDTIKPPPLLLDLHSGMTMDSFDPKRLGALVSQDPVLAAKLLAVANSALYAPAQPITAVGRALVHIGFVMARTIISSYQLELSFGGPRDLPLRHMLFVRQWSGVASVLAQHWAQAADLSEQGNAATLALLSRIGTLMLGLGETSGRVGILYLDNYIQYPDEISRLHYEQETWGVTTPCLSAELARRWGVPSPLPELLLRSWQPLVREQPDTEEGRQLTLACAAVALAADYIRVTEFSPEMLLEQPAYAILGENLHNLRLLHALAPVWKTVRLQRELRAAATE
jgi:HD-like signal output (HDOD) protein